MVNKFSYFVSALAVVLGILVAVFPETCIKFVVIVLGAASLVKGLYDFIRLRNMTEDSLFRRVVVVRSLVSIVLGLIALCLPVAFFKTAETLVRVLLYVLAVYLVGSAAVQFFLMSRLNEAGLPHKNFSSEAFVCLLLAVMLFLLPADFGVKIVRFAGIAVAVLGALYGLYVFLHKPLVVEPDSVRDADSAQADGTPSEKPAEETESEKAASAETAPAESASEGEAKESEGSGEEQTE